MGKGWVLADGRREGGHRTQQEGCGAMNSQRGVEELRCCQRLSPGQRAAARGVGVRVALCWELCHCDLKSGGPGVSRTQGDAGDSIP